MCFLLLVVYCKDGCDALAIEYEIESKNEDLDL